MENMEMNNTAVEVLEEVAEMPNLDVKKVGVVVGGIAGTAVATILVKKFVVPKVKAFHEDRKAKRLEKKLNAAKEVEVVVE